MLDEVAQYAGVAADFLFPRLCCGCEQRIIEPRRVVCLACQKSMEPLRLPICDTCGSADARLTAPARCDDCPAGTIYFEKARATTAFGGTAKLVVEKLKYSQRLEYVPLMARQMFNVMLSQLHDVSFDLIIPVPLHSTRQRERGFNQSAELAKELGSYCGTNVCTNGLLRVRPTPSQTRLNRKQRAKNIFGAFELGSFELAGKVCLLVDDVHTTGATLNECSRILSIAGAESIYCLAFARAVL